MGRKLAIRGNVTENLVINILESLGGKNSHGLIGTNIENFYIIKDNGIIDSIHQEDVLFTEYEFHTIESYFKEYGTLKPKRHCTKEMQDFNKIEQDITTFRMMFTTFLLKYKNDKVDDDLSSIFKKIIDIDILIKKYQKKHY